MDTPESVLRRLEFKVVRRLDGLLFGDYTGVFYGPSLDLAEVREYQPGDEVRRIDWNVTARMHRLFVRQYLEERELTAWMLVDLSPSMVVGTRRQQELARRHDVVAVWISDPAEQELPDVGGLFVRDPETGQQLWVDTSDARLRETYRALAARQRAAVAAALHAAAVDALELSTAEPLLSPLLRFITYRRRRSRWSLAGR